MCDLLQIVLIRNMAKNSSNKKKKNAFLRFFWPLVLLVICAYWYFSNTTVPGITSLLPKEKENVNKGLRLQTVDTGTQISNAQPFRRANAAVVIY